MDVFEIICKYVYMFITSDVNECRRINDQVILNL